MKTLSVTIIDVGSGDSIFLEAEGVSGAKSYALVDSNDEVNWRSTETFLLRYLRTHSVPFGAPGRLFTFVLLTHAHSDHMCGLKRLLQVFGTESFYYPESAPSAEFAAIMRYVQRACAAGSRVGRHQAVNIQTQLPALQDTALQILWPPPTALGVPYDMANPNNNSVVLGMTLDKVKLVLTGDCEADNWPQIIPSIRKAGLRFFKVPHHGAYNGLFDGTGAPAWTGILNKTSTHLALSTHVSPYGHPDAQVMTELENRVGKLVFRTDENYHITFKTHGSTYQIKFARL
jgi:beta-lactamase superfamily II metal-dependent hydrolase